MRSRFVRSAALAAIAALAVLASSCAVDRGRGGTLVISTAGDPDLLFPPMQRQQQAREVTDLLFDKLAEIGSDLNTIGDAGWTPRLARGWEWSLDSMEVTFHLEPRARWHDSVPVRASDVLFAYSVYTDPAIGSSDGALMASMIDSLTLRDSVTFTVWYGEPRPERFYSFVYWLVPLPEHLLGSVPRDSLRTSAFARAPVGNGPFRFVRWEPRQRVEVEAVRDYYLGAARLDRVIWTIVPDGQTAVQRMFAGEADFIGVPLSPADVADISNHSQIRSVRLGSTQYTYLQFNMVDGASGRPHPILANREMRRALTLAVDRRAVARNLVDSLARVPFGPFARAQWSADSSLRQLLFDRDEAARILDSLGWVAGGDGMRSRGGRPLSIGVAFPASSSQRQGLATVLQEQWRAVGVNAELERLEVSAMMSRVGAGQFDAVLMTVAPAPSPSGIRQTWSTAAHSMSNGLNLGKYSNAAIDASIDSAVSASSIDAARAHYRAAYQGLLDDAAAIWLLEPIVVGAVNGRVTLPMLRTDAWWTSIPGWRVTGAPPPAVSDTATRTP
jgi:peptide/nickel transport system substrate-binding protein